MTIALNNSSPQEYPGNGTAVSFSFPWKIFSATDLLVGFVVGGLYTLQSSSTYTISGINNNGGGQVVFSTAPPIGTTVDLRTETPETQATEFANLGDYLPENTTNALDRITRIVQDLTRLTYTFGIHGPDDEYIAWPALPVASARIAKSLIFGASGLPEAGIPSAVTYSQSTLGELLYPPLAAEGATVVNPYYFYGVIDRYGTNTTPGTTVMDTAVQNAQLAAAALGVPMNHLFGPYLTTESIPNYHSTFKAGKGIITRSGDSFYPQPTASQPNTLYVSTTGLDANDGLSASQPMLTPQNAVNSIISYGAILLLGVWAISHANGDYTTALPSVATIPQGLLSLNPIQFNGPGGAGTTPTVFYGPSSGSATYNGIVGNGSNSFTANNIWFQNLNNGGNAYGLNGQQPLLMWSSNCYFTNVDTPIKCQGGRLLISGGYVSGGVVGVTAIGGTIVSLGYGDTVAPTTGSYGGVGQGPCFTGQSQACVLMQDGANGHVDYTLANNGAVGIDIIGFSQCHSVASNLTNNATAGVRYSAGSHWLNDPTTPSTFSGNAVNELAYSGSINLGRSELWTTEIRQPVSGAQQTTSGTAATVLATFTNAIVAANFNNTTKALKVEGAGQIVNTNSTKSLVINLDGNAALTFAIPATPAGAFWFKAEIQSYTTAGTQLVRGVMWVNGMLPIVVQAVTSLTLTNGTITLVGQCANASDQIELQPALVASIGGA